MMEIFNWLRSTYGARNHELYYSPAGGRQILQGLPYNTKGTAAYKNHFDHVHWAMKAGGLVPGTGFGDKVPAMLEPRERVINRKASDTFGPLLQAINSGDWTKAAMPSDVDNRGGNLYNVKIEFNGPVNTEIDFKRGVTDALRNIEKRKGPKRRV